MATPVIESKTTNIVTNTDTITLTKPTGLEVGDELVAFVGFFQSGGNRTWNTPSGWTLRQSNPNESGVALFTKTATSTEVAASNFDFTISDIGDLSGVLFRISGHVPANPYAGSELDDETAPTGTGFSYTTNITPDTTNSLILMLFFGYDKSLSGTPTVSGYATTPSATFTEEADLGQVDGFNDGFAFGVASAPYSGLSTITNRSATMSEAVTEDKDSIIVIINGTQSASVTLDTIELVLTPRAITATGNATVTLDTVSLTLTPGTLTASEIASDWVNTDKSADPSFVNTPKT